MSDQPEAGQPVVSPRMSFPADMTLCDFFAAHVMSGLVADDQGTVRGNASALIRNDKGAPCLWTATA